MKIAFDINLWVSRWSRGYCLKLITVIFKYIGYVIRLRQFQTVLENVLNYGSWKLFIKTEAYVRCEGTWADDQTVPEAIYNYTTSAIVH